MDRDVVYQARLHWILFGWPVFLLCLAVYVGMSFPAFSRPSLIFAFVFLAWVVMTWVTYHFSSLTIKKNQLILRTGVLVRRTIDIPFTKIESIDIRQPILGSILHYGSLVIIGTGGTQRMIHHINRPLTCRRHIEQLMHREN